MHKTKVDLSKIKNFESVAMDFYFTKDSTSLIFAKQDSIFQINFETEKVETIFKFKDRLHMQP